MQSSCSGFFAVLALVVGAGLACSSTSCGQAASPAGSGLGPDSGSGGSGSGSSSGASGSSSGTSSGSGSSSGAQTCDGGACNNVPPGLLNPDFTTNWNPGILADTPTGSALGNDGLPVRTTTCASVPAQSGDATSAIQKALMGCIGKNQVVMLAAGTYSISAPVVVPSGVVLRGAGSDGANKTVLLSTGGGPVVQIGTTNDTICYNNAFVSSSQPLLTADATKETSKVTVASAAGFVAGDLALIDQNDTSEVVQGDCNYFKRLSAVSASERVEISAVSGNTLTLTTPLHWTFTVAQKATISKVATAPTKWAGVEHLLVQGGRPGSYPGAHAGGVELSNAAYSWVKDVQVDGTTSGMGMRMVGTYRCVVRDSHVHNSYSYGFAQDNYGIVIGCGGADNLVENNISRFMDKPVVFDNSGGGNVAGYNYADNSWSCDGSGDDGQQEASIDCHCSFPHMELMEGNWAPHLAAANTHGNAGYLTYFRNYASSQWALSVPGQATSAIVWSQNMTPQYGNVEAIQLDTPDLKMTIIGNVLGSTGDASLGLPADQGTTGNGTAAATSQTYVAPSPAQLAILAVDQSTVTWSTIWLHGNFDTVNKKVMWNASPLTANLPASTQKLPASLYYATKPKWWPSGTPWPWAGPDLTPKVGTLPAQKASKAYNYYNSADGACTLNCGSYCCSVGPACSL